MKNKSLLPTFLFLLFSIATTWAETIDLTTVQADRLQDGYILNVADGDELTGTLEGSTQPYKISIADGATVTLRDVTINGYHSSSYKWAGISCEGDCNIVLADNSVNKVKGFYMNYPGVYVPEESKLIISGTGSLDASSHGYGAGIGGGRDINCGDIEIRGGTITAKGGNEAAGIGGGNDGSIGDIIISGGSITATGGLSAAGIGGGKWGNVKNIAISGDETEVIAKKGDYAPYSIGKDYRGSRSGKITIGGVETSDIETSPFIYTRWMGFTNITVASIPDQTYTGSAICPTVSVTDGETLLKLGTDYTATCTNNKSAGTANMTITCMGDYECAISKTFKITQKEITINWSAQTSFVYNGMERAPKATAEGLVTGDFCWITVSGAKDVGTHMATAIELSNDNYKLPKENLEKTFEITQREISIAWGTQTSFVYDGAEHIPTATIEGVLDGDNCELTVTGAQKNVGEYIARATVECGDKDYYKLPTENLEKTFEITQREITIAWGTQTSFVYNGAEQAPTATAEGLVTGDECTITVSGAKDVGASYTALATKLSNDNYKLPTGNLEKTFEITQREISIAWGEQTSFAYDGAEHIPTATVEGVLDGDNCELTVTGAQKNVGEYTARATVVCDEKNYYKLPKEIIEQTFVILGTNLAALESDFVVQSGDVLSGLLNGSKQPYKISIADGATVTFNGVTINGDNRYYHKWAGITCQGDCNIILAENSENKVKGFYNEYPGIYVPENKTLTISGTGSLEASSNGYAAGIGCGYQISCGNITISEGSITAIGGHGYSGIGGGNLGSVGDIVISGGVIDATGGPLAAGIGGGGGAKVNGNITNSGNITISGGIISASGGTNAAGIGFSKDGKVDANIEISGAETKVTARRGENAPYSIGSGSGGSRTGTITIGGVETQDIEINEFDYTKWKLLTHTDITIADITDQTYTGSAICPNVVVKDDKTTLELSVDYTVECTNNIAAGQAKMTITGMGYKGNSYYAGSITKTFEIMPKEISIAWDKQTSFVYNGTEQAPTATAEGLVDGDECTITVSGAKDVGSYTATATKLSNDNYKLPTENLEKTFEITPKEITVIWGNQTSFVYNGTEQAPTATAEGLVDGDECLITVSGAKDVGSHTATATKLSNANYKLPTTGLEQNFEITKATLTITAKNKTIAYGDEPANDGVEYAGFAGEENASVLGGTLTYGYNYEKGNKTGEYTITPSGLTADNYEINFVSGTLTVETKKTTFAAIQVFEDENGKRAEIAGEYDGPDAVNITEDIQNVAVTFNRNFTVDLEKGGFSTLMLPFSVSTEDVGGLGGVYMFAYVADCDGDKKNDVCISKVWEDSDTKHQTLEAYTPYMVRMKESTLKINKNVTLAKTSGGTVYDQRMQTEKAREGSWQMRGVFGYKKWACNDDELGKVWGYTGEPRDGQKIGKYMKLGKGVWINPFRAYLFDPDGEQLKCTDESNTDGSKPQPIAASPYAKAYTAEFLPAPAKSAASAPASSEVASLDEFGGMQVVVVDGDKESVGGKGTTVIGRMNPATGEIRMLPRTKQTYDLKGRRVNEGKKAKGAYYRK